MAVSEKRIPIGNIETLHKIFGNMDEYVNIIEKHFNIKIAARDGDVVVMGDQEQCVLVERLFHSLLRVIKAGDVIDRQRVEYFISTIQEGQAEKLSDLSDATICVTSRGKFVKPKTLGQKKYIEAIYKNDVIFGIGPAGTGKTYLAVAMAIRAFKNNEISRIVITRPAVEAGESLGFLPGDLQSKIDPYLRPIHDALYDILGSETFQKFKERGLIEVAPLAYMRGRTLDNSFIILDEAQNTTREQMKMFLTRFGFGSKVVVNGDITQVDLPGGKKSGLIQAIDIFGDVEGIKIVKLTDRDVVRHSLVKKIIQEYDKYEKRMIEEDLAVKAAMAAKTVRVESKGRR